MKILYGIRPVLASVTLAALAACSTYKDQLLSPQQPGIIGPDQVSSPTAADALRLGALSRLKTATVGTTGTETMYTMGGLLTDEWKSGDTFSQRVETDQRSIQTSNADVASFYSSQHSLRGAAKDAIDALNKYLPEPKANFGQMYWVYGLAEMQLSEAFCNGVPFGITVNGVPQYGDPVTNAQGFALAQAHIDSGLTYVTATDTFAVNTKYNLLLTKARILIDVGKFSDAAALVTSVPTAYRYFLTFSLTTADNPVWSFNASQKRWVVGDSFDITGVIKNALPFASANDPRVPVLGTTLNSSLKTAFDNSTQLVSENIWGQSDWIPILSGIDARLYEAEAKLQASDIAGMMTILNALRAAPQALSNKYVTPVMAALPTPATQDAATSLFFREKAFWQFSRGTRLGDLRRLVRQYKRTQDNVFPTGTFHKNGNPPYGTDVNFPVTTNENPNPAFHGCIDRNA
ncbi:MAG: hypothetical protein ABI442_03955 [Gemmatimonadaceae bacterium]